MSGLPSVPPTPAPELATYWEANRRGVLLVPRCTSCGSTFWYPRAFCPFCHSEELAWDEASGGATIYSFTVVERGQGPWQAVAPYAVAYVELDEGPKMLTNIVDCDPSGLEVGQRVQLVFDDAGEHRLPRFRPEP
jgi:uncharacterized OB-fold protein